MTFETAQRYIGQTCRVNYTNIRGFKSSRAGVVTNVTIRKIVLLLFVDNGEDYEMFCDLKSATIHELKPNIKP